MKKEEQKVKKIKDVTKLTGMIRALKATVAVGHGSLLTGFHQLSLKKLKLISLKTQNSVIKSGLSLPISRDGGDAVLVAWSWQWWHEGCGFCGMGFCWVVGWSDGYGSVVEWSRAMVAYGLWARDRRQQRVVCGWEQRPLSLLSLSVSLSSLFSISLTPILSLRLGFGFGLIWRGI